MSRYLVVSSNWSFLQICAIPPSTQSSMPVTKLLSFDARKETALAISSGLPNLPRGMALKYVVINFSASCMLCKACFKPAVSIGPGLIALTRSVLVYFRVSLKNRKKTKMKGNEAKLYATIMGSLESNTNAKLKYIANNTQMIPIITYCFVLKTNMFTLNLR